MSTKLSIAFCVPGMAFSGKSPYERSLGGSETAGWALAKAMAARGHRVRVFCNLPDGHNPGNYDDVTYMPLQMWQQFAATVPTDVHIVQRMPDLFSFRTASKLNYLWCHDLAMGRIANAFRSVMWNIDRVICVSEYMRGQYKEVLDLPDDTMMVLKNGIINADFPEWGTFNRDRKHLIYAARPERGLDVLFKRILPKLFEADPELRLSIYGYDNPTDAWRDYYRGLAQSAQQFGDRARFVGYLPKRELYAAYSQAGVYVYPTPSPALPGFNEVSCISAMEAQRAGLPIVTSRRGALPETICPEAGTLIDGDPMSDEYVDAFCAGVLRYTTDNAAWMAASEAGALWGTQLDWSTRAKEMEDEIEERFRTLNNDPTRLAYHFYRHNDIIVAGALLKEVLNPETGLVAGQLSEASKAAAERLQRTIRHEYRWMKDQHTFRQHYLKGGRETTERLQKHPPESYARFFHDSDEKRFHAIVEELGKRELESGAKVIDYGCGHGWSTIYFANKYPTLDWTGIDIDPGAAMWASKMAEHHAVNRANVNFICGDHETLTKHVDGQRVYDVAIVSEVLEHCTDPISTLAAIEKTVKIGGMVILTVPYGPSEYGTANWDTFRNHLWEFELADIYDMLDHKPGLNVSGASIYPNPVLGEIIGFWYVTYRVDETGVMPVDLDRKFRYQRPRQTVSVNMIGGGDVGDTIRWALKSCVQNVDEVVIGDTGTMTDLTKQICTEFGCRVVPTRDALKDGFESPRNDLLAASWTDWVLWIDSDERLLGGDNMTRYLRESMWDGVSIRQHHFAVDTSFPADLPVRLIRRARPDADGNTIRFFGMIHEHPEHALNKGPGSVLVVPDVNIAHIGYLYEPGRKVKFHRNYPLLQADIAKYPDRILQKHFICRDNAMLNMYDFQQNGGQITDEMKARAHETVRLFNEYFLGKETFVNIDSSQYYTAALRLLGEGIDLTFNLQVNREGQGDALSGEVLRFRTADEAVTFITSKARERLGQMDRKFW